MGADFQPAPPAAISRFLSTYDREQLAGFIEVAIGLLDLAEPDPDLELNGDEFDGDATAEDEFGNEYLRRDIGAGDPGDAEDDDPGACDAADDGCGPMRINGRIVWGADREG